MTATAGGMPNYLHWTYSEGNTGLGGLTEVPPGLAKPPPASGYPSLGQEGGAVGCPLGEQAPFALSSTAYAVPQADGSGLLSPSWLLLNFVLSALTSVVLQAQVTGDTVNRYAVQADGKIQWGPGNAAVDTNLYRSGTGVVRTDGTLYGRNGVATGGGVTSARPASPVLYAMWYDTTMGKPIWWSGTNWKDATGATV